MSKVLSYIHLSDIHFGQERGGDLYVHNDVKDQLVRDVGRLAAEREEQGLDGFAGLLITGDIAFAGKPDQYADASKWLKKLTTAAGCDETAVLVVPGNHDIDRARVTLSYRLMLERIEAKGQAGLDDCLKTPQDRDVLYERFAAYRQFAFGYGCELSQEGGRAAEKRVELAPGKTVAFAGLNSALLCRDRDDEPGELMLGSRQHVFEEEDGVAHVALIHHPLDWLADGKETLNYLRNRTAVLLSGHVHMPKIEEQSLDDKLRFVSIAAGAAVPPAGEDAYAYTYNVLEFALGDDEQSIALKIHGRTWNGDRLRFDADENRFGDGNAHQTFVVHCPTYCDAKAATSQDPASEPIVALEGAGPNAPSHDAVEVQVSEDLSFARLRLKYFRMDASERMRVLGDLQVLPQGVAAPSLTIERQVFEQLNSPKYLDALAAAIEAQTTTRGG